MKKLRSKYIPPLSLSFIAISIAVLFLYGNISAKTERTTETDTLDVKFAPAVAATTNQETRRGGDTERGSERVEKVLTPEPYPLTPESKALTPEKPSVQLRGEPPGRRSVLDEKWVGNGVYAQFKPEDEIISKRDAVAKHFRNPDGSITAIISSAPIHYKDSNGAWQDIETDIKTENKRETPLLPTLPIQEKQSIKTEHKGEIPVMMGKSTTTLDLAYSGTFAYKGGVGAVWHNNNLKAGYDGTTYHHLHGWVQWNTSSIDDGASITNTRTWLYYSSTTGGAEPTYHVYDLTRATFNYESKYNNWDLFYEISDHRSEGSSPDYYYNDYNGINDDGTWIDLGTTADSDLESRLSADWFCYGIGPDKYWNTRYMNWTYSGVNCPKLEVTYTEDCTPPANETCAGATVVTYDQIAAGYSTSGVLGCTDDCVGRGYFDVFYRYDCTCTGSYTVDMYLSAEDTYLRIFSGSCCGTLHGSDDDGAGDLDPSWTGTLTSGTTYWFECGSYDATGMENSAYNFNMTTTCVSNTPPVASNCTYSGGSYNLLQTYAGQQYTWTIDYTDADGAANLHYGWFGYYLETDGGWSELFIIRNDIDANTYLVVGGASNVTVNSITRSSITNGYRYTLTFTPLWNMDNADACGWDVVPAYAVEDDAAERVPASGYTVWWYGDNSNMQIENDVRVYTVNYTDPVTHNTNFTVSGNVEYQGVTTPNPPNVFDVRVDPDWTTTNYDDNDCPNGAYSISVLSYDLCETRNFQVLIYNYPTGAGITNDATNSITTDGCEGCCIAPDAYGSATAPTDNVEIQITSCNYAGEYSEISSVVSGQTYQFRSDIGTDWLSLTNTSNTCLVYGTTPINWTATFSGDVRLHIHTNSSCGTDASCHETYIQCTSCPPPCVTPSTPVANAPTGITQTHADFFWSASTGDPTITYYWAVGTASTVTYESGYTDRGTTTGLTASTDDLGPGTTYYFRLKACNSCPTPCSDYSVYKQFTTSECPGSWTGNANSNWNDVGNWSAGIVPTPDIDVTIPAGRPNYPNLPTTNSVSYSFSPDPKQGSTVLISDGAVVQNSSDQIDYVEISSVDYNTIHVKIRWYPSDAGNYTEANGIHLKAWHYDGSTWREAYSHLMVPSDFTINTWTFDEFDYDIPSATAVGTNYIRSALIDRAYGGTDEMTGHYGCGSCGTAGVSDRHYDNADVSFAVTVVDATGPYYCRSITINSGGTLTMTDDELHVAGNWTNNGTFNRGAGTVVFDGSADASIIKPNSIESFNILQISKDVKGGKSRKQVIPINRDRMQGAVRQKEVISIDTVAKPNIEPNKRTSSIQDAKLSIINSNFKQKGNLADTSRFRDKSGVFRQATLSSRFIGTPTKSQVKPAPTGSKAGATVSQNDSINVKILNVNSGTFWQKNYLGVSTEVNVNSGGTFRATTSAAKVGPPQ